MDSAFGLQKQLSVLRNVKGNLTALEIYILRQTLSWNGVVSHEIYFPQNTHHFNNDDNYRQLAISRRHILKKNYQTLLLKFKWLSGGNGALAGFRTWKYVGLAIVDNDGGPPKRS